MVYSDVLGLVASLVASVTALKAAGEKLLIVKGTRQSEIVDALPPPLSRIAQILYKGLEGKNPS